MVCQDLLVFVHGVDKDRATSFIPQNALENAFVEVRDS